MSLFVLLAVFAYAVYFYILEYALRYGAMKFAQALQVSQRSEDGLIGNKELERYDGEPS